MDGPIDAGRQRWQRRFDQAVKRDADFTTLSGLKVDPVYGPPDGSEVPDRIGWPGEFPFTRGLHASGYHGKPWTIRQFSGFGNARQTNERYKMLLRAGGAGLSVAFDMPTLMGRDSDDPRSLGEVGHCGVAIDSAADMDVLFDGIPLADITTSMTISGPAVPVFCMYVVAAERQGADLASLDGTLQTDIFKEYIAQKEWLFPPRPHLRLIGDLMDTAARTSRGTSRCPCPAITSGRPARRPRRNSRSRWRTGSDTSSSAFRAASTSTSSRPACRSSSMRTSTSSRRSRSSGPPAGSGRGGCATSTAPDRARPMAALPHPDRGCLADRAAAGQQRRAHRGRSAGGRTRRDKSLHTNALDEVLALPSEEAAEIALRTQQVIMQETGVTNVADPLGGSWYVEALTDRMEAEAEAIFAAFARWARTAR